MDIPNIVPTGMGAFILSAGGFPGLFLPMLGSSLSSRCTQQRLLLCSESICQGHLSIWAGHFIILLL